VKEKNPKSDAAEVGIRRAFICAAEALPDESMREATREHFGSMPIAFVSVSRRLYRAFGEENHQHPARLVVYGQSHPRILVLMLQFGGHQLRLVVSLLHEPAQDWLRTTNRTGICSMVLCQEESGRYAGLACDVSPDDLAVIPVQPLPAEVVERGYRAMLRHVALGCLLRAEEDSLVEGLTLQRVDVAVVDEVSLPAMPANA
jgi:hypothetical protein